MFPAFFLFLISLTLFARPALQDVPAAYAPAQDVTPKPCSDLRYTQTDLNVCFDKLYQDADAQLNVEYNKIVGFMKKHLGAAQSENGRALTAHNETAMAKLLKAQRAWLAYRDAHCESVKFQYEGGSIQPMAWSQCMADTTQQRIATLTTAYDVTD